MRAGSPRFRHDVLDYRRREAELLFRRIGITFAVYGEADAQERLIPFDVLPRILAGRRMGHPARRARAARQGHQPLHPRHLRPARDPQGRHRAGGPGVPEPGVPAGDERPESAARHLRAYRRHRHRAGRSRHLLRARGQCPHALRRLLHAGEPGDHAAAVSGTVRPPPRGAGRELSRRAAGDPEIGGARDRERRSDRRAAHAGRLQLRLLRALLPGRQARRRAGRRPRPLRQGRGRVHAHHRGAQARRRDLSADRRRLPRSARVPARFRARRARA